MMTDRPVKRSVALAIRDGRSEARGGRSEAHAGRSEADGATTPAARVRRVLLVQRPPDDEDLPLVWGLPAASLAEGESWEDAVRRAARDKLGITVEPGAVLAAGERERPGYRLEMRLYEARITGGTPAVPQPVHGVTQYVGWRWGEAAEIEPAARAGSLCSRLFLEAEGRAPGSQALG